jgi:hypothetical protein
MAYDPYAYNPHQRDFQDDWNNYAADQNASVLQERAANPGPDPRQLAAQSLVQRYQQKAPSYANIQGKYFINGEPIDTTASFMGVPMGDTGERGAQLQFAMAKQRAAQDFLNRQSGNYAAGTAPHAALLRDPQFQGLPDDQTRNAVYSQAIGHPLAEDLQADQLGGNMTMHDLRYRNDLPNRQKAIGENFKIFEQASGANPMALTGNLARDEKGNPVSGYDPEHEVAWVPGQTISDGFGGFVQKPAHSVPMPAFQYQHLRDMQAQLSGLDRFPAPHVRNPMDIIGGANQAAISMLGDIGNAWGIHTPNFATPEARQTALSNATQAMQTAHQTLRSQGIVLDHPTLLAAVERAAHLSGDQHPTDGQIVGAARDILDERQLQSRQQLERNTHMAREVNRPTTYDYQRGPMGNPRYYGGY